MNIGIFYFSRTGNTKRFAQAIGDAIKAPFTSMATAQPSETQNFDLLMLGTPVEGASPTKEAIAFIDNMPNGEGKKAVLFVTYRLFGNKRAMNSIDKRLAEKGYKTILMVSKKSNKNENPPDYSEALAEIKKAIEKL